MVVFKEPVPSKHDMLFVKEDAARLYRGLREMLVEEFDVDRIEEGRMEFNVEKPKDRVRLQAFKEKSPHTVIHWKLSIKAKRPRHTYRDQRPEGILKARYKISPTVITVYPGGEPLEWAPRRHSEWPIKRQARDRVGLRAEELTPFQKSKFYEVLTGVWYNIFYAKEIERYQEEAEESAVRMANLFREKFGLEEAIWRSGAGHYNPPWK